MKKAKIVKIFHRKVLVMQTIKCVVVGNEGVGKTCLLMTYSTHEFPSEFIPTVCNDFFEMTVVIKENCYTLDMQDSQGQEVYDRLRPLSYPQTDVFLVCFSVVIPSSFKSITEKWVPEISHHCPQTPFLLVGTQVDLRDDPVTFKKLPETKEPPISVEYGNELARELKAFKYVECSALMKKGLNNVFDEAV